MAAPHYRHIPAGLRESGLRAVARNALGAPRAQYLAGQAAENPAVSQAPNGDNDMTGRESRVELRAGMAGGARSPGLCRDEDSIAYGR